VAIIELDNVSYSYTNTSSSHPALSNVNFSIEEGSFVSILGSNGSGKSTFAKLLNSLLLPTEGKVLIDGLDTKEKSNLIAVRTKVGIVFQNPDTQIICDTVEDDIAFGLENMGLPIPEMRARIKECLEVTGLDTVKDVNPQKLSGGQKQLVAIAGVLAMHPKCIILDEATSMLDNISRKTVLDFVLHLNRDYGLTIILITHHIEECINANRIIVLDKGTVLMDDEPSNVFANTTALRKLELAIPPILDLSERLTKKGISLPRGIVTEEQFCNAVRNIDAWKNATLENKIVKLMSKDVSIGGEKS